MRSRPLLLPLIAVVLAVGAAPTAATTIVINPVDSPGIGFNDPTPVVAVGGNPGTTLGAQRLNVFQFAADLWEAALTGVGATSDVPIVVQATFQPLFCTATSGVLGAAGTIQIFANFPGADWPNTWHHSALSNELAGLDLTPGPPDPGLLVPPFNDDIVSFFHGAIGVDPACLTGLDWYYGLDNNAAGNEIDLLNVVMHEFAHGLGFANFVDDATGNAILGLADIYSVFSRDNTFGKHWNQMDKRERKASAVNTGNLVWDGPTVFAEAPGELIGIPVLRVNAPLVIAGDYAAQPASYGPLPPPAPGVIADVALYDDGIGPDPNDACDCPFVGPGLCVNSAPLPTDLVGKIALINRGTCGFALKSALAQLAGAAGVVITNNLPVGLSPMGGSALLDMSIPSIGVSQATGNAIKAELPGVNAAILADQALGLSGTDANGFVRLYAPSPVQPGSSVSHWDTLATPNLLMEPFINSDLAAATDLDLTPAQMQDIGWDGTAHCPVGSDDQATVVIDSCDSGVPNSFGPFQFSLGRELSRTPFGLPGGESHGISAMGGCHIMDMVNACAQTSTGGEFTSCISHATNYLQRIGEISEADAKSIEACAK